MRALIFDGKSVRLSNSHPPPELRQDEAIIRLSRAAVNALDVQVGKGLLGFRGVLGNQFVGVIESTGAHRGNGSPDLAKGQRVVGSPVTFCSKCDMCLAGLSRHCRCRSIPGVQGRDGCLADRFSWPMNCLVALPDSVDDDHGVLAVLVAASMQAAEQLTIVGKPYITVLGDGTLGLLTAQVMAKLNASVRVIGRHARNLALCEKWGIKHREAEAVGRRSDQDVVVDCTGTAAGLELAMQLVRPRGKILLKTLLAPPAGCVDLTPLVTKEVELIGSFAGSVVHAVRALERREIEVASLIGRRMSLEEGPAILRAAELPAGLTVIVTC